MPSLPHKYGRNVFLYPIGLMYGFITGIRNVMFNIGLKKEHQFNIPIINVGNIAVGGTGKTPHTEYLVRMLQDTYRIAVLSRGYKRKTKGYVVADENSSAQTIGDEPYQIHKKFPKVIVAVCEKRVDGVNRLVQDFNPQIILLDDAFQHRYVKPSINIMLTDFNRFIAFDLIMPAGRLRESKKSMRRADIVIVTKCPGDVDMDGTASLLRKYTKADICFSTFTYGHLEHFRSNDHMPLDDISKNDSVILVTGIANPTSLIDRLSLQTGNIETIQFADHHSFDAKDINAIEDRYCTAKSRNCGNVYVITTQKDSARLEEFESLPTFSNSLWIIPVEASFIGNNSNGFKDNILDRLSVQI